jgi:hypothetical protein
LTAAVGVAPVHASDGETESAGRVCVSQLNADSARSFPSQNFEPDFDAYDNVAADDFTVARRCRARVVTVVGNYGAGSGPADSETVTFYRDKTGRPGRVVSTQTVTAPDDAIGTFDLPLDEAVRLRAGRKYWVSIQISMNFAESGVWLWEMQSVVDGAKPVWKNPGDGYGYGCVDWTEIETCAGAEWSGGLMFEIRTR